MYNLSNSFYKHVCRTEKYISFDESHKQVLFYLGLFFYCRCSDDYDLIGDDFDNDDLSDPSIRRIWTILYAFKFYNSDELYFECFVTICPSSSSSCDLVSVVCIIYSVILHRFR